MCISPAPFPQRSGGYSPERLVHNVASHQGQVGAFTSTSSVERNSGPKLTKNPPRMSETPAHRGVDIEKEQRGNQEDQDQQRQERKQGNSDDLDDNNDDNLSPPPDSPELSPAPSESIPAGNNTADEIVVGTNSNGIKPSPTRANSDLEDAEMEDADDQAVVSHYPKRKRNSIYTSLNEDKVEAMADTPGEDSSSILLAKPRTHGLGHVRGIQIGYWRDSTVPDEADRHAVIGFIDVRDRLRTRIQQVSRSQKLIADKYPLPPGPGGSWVTFECFVFADHLVNLDHHQVKEYVKVRAETFGTEKTEQEIHDNDLAAVREAIRRNQLNPPPETAVIPPVAYGVEIPEHALAAAGRQDAKRRRLAGFANGNNGTEDSPGGGGSGGANTSAGIGSGSSALDPLPGTRPTKILLGYWRGSSEPDMKNKHAVFGILGANDMFRVKVTKETRDGRVIHGNFPQGAGALWIPYDDVCMEPHIRDLSRPEIKEYCRVRQYQIDRKEAPEDRLANEARAVHEAQIRAGKIPTGPLPTRTPKTTQTRVEEEEIKEARQRLERSSKRSTPDDEDSRHPVPKRTYTGHDLRQARRGFSEARSEGREGSRAARHSLPSASSLRAANRPESGDRNGATPDHSNDRMERVNSLARQSVARAEAQQSRIDQRNAHREQQQQQHAGSGTSANPARVTSPSAAPNGSQNNNIRKAQFNEDIDRLNKVWQSQETQRLKSGSLNDDDTKVYGGIKYERKQNGPFLGKLVSQGTIISIDGEDYVEYRVLTKPSFF